MAPTLKATFTVDSWDEEPILAVDDAPKVTRAVVTKTYDGDLGGTSTTEWLMAYAPDDTATFVGLERLTISSGEQTGTVVLQHVGTFAEGAATADLTVVPGSGSGDLAEATGSGSFRADPAGSVTLDLSTDG